MASTPFQTVGPFFNLGLLRPRDTDLAGDASEAIEISGRVLEDGGIPVNCALVETWQADGDGRYDGASGFNGFGRCLTRKDGRFALRTIKPGPVAGRGNAQQAPHILVTVFAAGLLRRLVTRIYFPDEPLNEADPVLGTIDDPVARQTLVARAIGGGKFCFDIVLHGAGETAFFID